MSVRVCTDEVGLMAATSSSASDGRSALKAILQEKRRVRRAPIGDLLSSEFPEMATSKRLEVKSLLEAKGVSKGVDLLNLRAGELLDEGAPEWVCKVFVEKELIRSGPPSSVIRDSSEVFRLDLKSAGHEFEILRDCPNKELLDRLQTEFRWKPWLALARADMQQNEAVCFREKEVESLYGFRAVLRTLVREAPVPYELIDDECFIGTFLFSMPKEEKDWSKVVFMLQVQSYETEYGEALGRLVRGVREIFKYQKRRELVHGVVCGTRFVHVFKFGRAGDGIPQSVARAEFSLYQPLGGFQVLVTLMCALPSAHGFISSDGNS